jgi:hypothetical protein
MIPVETIPGVGEGLMKKNNGGGEFKYDYIVRTFVNATVYLHTQKKMLWSLKSYGLSCARWKPRKVGV